MIPVSLCSDAVPYNETYIMTPTLVNITMNLIDGTINYLNSTTLGASAVTISASLNTTPPLVFNMPVIITGFKSKPPTISDSNLSSPSWPF